MDLYGLVLSFSTGTYTVTRNAKAAVPFVRGIAAPSVTSIFTIIASVQPATGEDLLRLPEGRRTNETRVIFSTTELFTGDQGQPFDADFINVDGDDWEVQHRETWVDTGPTAGGIAYRYIAQAPTPQSKI